MKRKLVPVVALLVAALLLVAAAGCERNKSYRADRYDVDIQVQENNTAIITETVTLAFRGGPFTYAFREILSAKTDRISQIAVSEDGQAYTLGGGPGQYQVETRSNRLRVTWHFPPSENVARTFVLTYRVDGLIRQEGAQDALRWSAIPPEHEYGITQSRVLVSLPKAVGPLNGARVLAGHAQPGILDRQVTFLANQIEPNRQLTVGIWFPHGQLQGVPPKWQAHEMAQAGRAWLWIGLGAFILFFGLAAGIWAWRRYGRERVLSPAGPITAPPSDLPPGLAGALVHNRALSTDILATLFDLGRRGLIEVVETESSAGRRPKRRFVISRLAAPADLRPFEAATLQATFHKASGAEERVSLNDAATSLLGQHDAIARQFAAELTGRGLFGAGRDRIRRSLIVAGLAGLALAVASIAPTVAWRELYGPWPLLVTAALAVVGSTFLAAGSLAARRTLAGEQAVSEWRAFQRYLQQLVRGRGQPNEAETFDSYLLYAVTFGLAEKWAKRMAAAGAPAPAWFRALSREVEASTQAAAFVALFATVASVSAGGGASAGGAAGGGASGAG